MDQNEAITMDSGSAQPVAHPQFNAGPKTDAEEASKKDLSAESVIDSAEAWVESIRVAFQPYARFVEEVSTGLTHLEHLRDERISELLNEVEKLKLELSFKPVLAGVSSPSDPKPAASKPSKRVLLLDPVELNRVLVSHYFKGLPVALDYAKTPDEAMRVLGGAYDLLLVDFALKIEGEWLSWVRGQSRGTTLIAYSSSPASSELEQKALGMGFDGCLFRGEPKPALVEKLGAILWPV